MTGPIVSGRDPRFTPTLYAHVGKEGSWTLDYYLKHGGYETAKRVLKEKTPEEVIEEVKRSGLRGRGGAGFPTGVKWGFMPKDGKQHYLICNADESEPGSFKDRYIMEDVPHLLLEGMILAATPCGPRWATSTCGGSTVRRRTAWRPPSARPAPGLSGGKPLRHGLLLQRARTPGGWGLHLRGGDRSHELPGGPKGQPPPKTPLPRPSRGFGASPPPSTTWKPWPRWCPSWSGEPTGSPAWGRRGPRG